MNVSQWQLVEAFSEDLSLGPDATITEIPWLQKLAALPQLTRVEIKCGDFSPGAVLTQLPWTCELVIHTTGTTLYESLPNEASLAHLVTLHAIWNCDTMSTPDVDFSCLASCPNLRHVWLRVADYDWNHDLSNPDWVDLSTLDYLPSRCSVVLSVRNAARHIDLFQPPAGWSVAPRRRWLPRYPSEELIFSRSGS